MVTGGGSGLGRDMALALAKAGANVVVADLRPELAEDAAPHVRAIGRDALPFEMDVADASAVERCFVLTRERFGKVDILINNAGIGGQVLVVDGGWTAW